MIADQDHCAQLAYAHLCVLQLFRRFTTAAILVPEIHLILDYKGAKPCACVCVCVCVCSAARSTATARSTIQVNNVLLVASSAIALVHRAVVYDGSVELCRSGQETTMTALGSMEPAPMMLQ